jgi:hypothetical protein
MLEGKTRLGSSWPDPCLQALLALRLPVWHSLFKR